MGYSQEHKARSKARIVEMASERFREEGLSLSIAELMQAAGLTHGGFYNHFASRDELVAEAVGQAILAGQARYPASGERERTLGAFLKSYISRAHRDMAGAGCAMAALAGEVARADETTRDVFTRGFKSMLGGVRALLSRRNDAETQAMLVVSAAVGAVMLSRAVSDPATSDAILAQTRKALMALEG
jgi:TetR/AcrR family transcriptional repressor of nem operon